MKETFEVAAVVSEPTSVILRFVNWYLRQGARKITLFFDNPEDNAIQALPATERIKCIPCTDEIWHSLGVHPSARFTRRQKMAFNAAYRACESDWFLNVDADELMYFESMDLCAALHTFGQAKAVRILSMEAVSVPSRKGQHFRGTLGRAGFAEVYGADAPLAGRGAGMVGHSQGKSFIRSGQPDISLRHHWALDRDGSALEEFVIGKQQGAYLLHYLESGYTSWREKLEWRMSSRGFSHRLKVRITEAQSRPDPEAELQRLHKALFEIDEHIAQRLEERDALRCFDLNTQPT